MLWLRLLSSPIESASTLVCCVFSRQCLSRGGYSILIPWLRLRVRLCGIPQSPVRKFAPACASMRGVLHSPPRLPPPLLLRGVTPGARGAFPACAFARRRPDAQVGSPDVPCSFSCVGVSPCVPLPAPSFLRLRCPTSVISLLRLETISFPHHLLRPPTTTHLLHQYG